MSRSKHVTLLCGGNRLVVSPTTDEIYEILAPALTYVQSEYIGGRPGASRRGASGSMFEFKDIECFTLDYANRIATMLGYIERITDLLRKKNFSISIRHIEPLRPTPVDPTVFEPNFDNVYDMGSPRYRQDELLCLMASFPNGQFDAPPGFGKSKTVLFACAMFPRAKILVTADPVVVVRDMLYTELAGAMPRVGIVGGGKHIMRDRVMCATFDSLHHIDANWPDIVIVDECHQAGSAGASARLARFVNSRMYGLSATTEARTDGSDLITEGLFGPVRFRMPYTEALEHGLVGQIEVHWRSVHMSVNPCENANDTVTRDRLAYWTNKKRNQFIVEDARAVCANESVLVTCRTLEHLANLLSLCPEATLIYAEDPAGKTSSLLPWEGSLIPSQPIMTVERRQRLTAELQNGKPGIYITTPILNTGFNATRLRFLIRADGSSSEIINTQTNGRVSRESVHKSGGFVRDYGDEFDFTCRNRARKRSSVYQKHNWTQIYPGGGATSRLHTVFPGVWHDNLKKAKR